MNEIQQLVIDATEGQYTLTYFFPVKPANLERGPVERRLAHGRHALLQGHGAHAARRVARVERRLRGDRERRRRAADLDAGIARSRPATASTAARRRRWTAVFSSTRGSTGTSFTYTGGELAGHDPGREQRLDQPDDRPRSTGTPTAGDRPGRARGAPGHRHRQRRRLAERRRLHDPLPGHAQRHAGAASSLANAAADAARRPSSSSAAAIATAAGTRPSRRAPTSPTRRRRSTRSRC